MQKSIRISTKVKVCQLRPLQRLQWSLLMFMTVPKCPSLSMAVSERPTLACDGSAMVHRWPAKHSGEKFVQFKICHVKVKNKSEWRNYRWFGRHKQDPKNEILSNGMEKLNMLRRPNLNKSHSSTTNFSVKGRKRDWPFNESLLQRNSKLTTKSRLWPCQKSSSR